MMADLPRNSPEVKQNYKRGTNTHPYKEKPVMGQNERGENKPWHKEANASYQMQAKNR